MITADEKISATMTVREVMTLHPHLEAVFNKYGLTGCGGRKGPVEPIGFFATVHHVDPQVLLRELNELAANGQQEMASVQPSVEEADIYRPFVKSALAIVLTVGCTLGAINLAAMALSGVTGSYWEAITQAHGHAQILGWAGLFIMGVAYHVLPRLKATRLHGRPLAIASFWLVLVGIALRMVSQPLAESPSFASLVVLSALAELVGVSFFLYVVSRTLSSNPASADFWDKYVVASAVWLWISTAAVVAISLYTANTGLAIVPSGLNGPYLHAALMGFVAMMIFGITLRTIPVFMGLRAPNVRAFDLIFWALNLSIAVKAGSGWLEAVTGTAIPGAVGLIGGALEYASLLAFVYFLGILGRPERDVSAEGASRTYEKFIKAAYLWLLVAATMSAVYALYQSATGQAVPHSLVGAYRHALTVGFISMTIVGMSARIIPVFTGARLHSDLMLLATFVLLNLGNTVRVLSQPLADWVGGPFFATMGISGFVEVTALALFAYNLWRTIDSPVDEQETASPAQPAGSITANMVVADVLNRFPQALDILVSHGFTPLLNPVGRRTLARAVTLEQAAQMKGVDLGSLLLDLNRSYNPPSALNPPSGNGTLEHPKTEATSSVELGASVSLEQVTAALRSCYDPEIPVNIVDLGLVYGVQVEGGSVRIQMTLTAPGCPMGDQMLEEVKQALTEIVGVREVEVELVFDPPWTPDRMAEGARRQMGIPLG